MVKAKRKQKENEETILTNADNNLNNKTTNKKLECRNKRPMINHDRQSSIDEIDERVR